MDAEGPLDRRRTQFPGDLKIGVQLHVGQFVVEHLELLRRDRDLHGPDLAGVQRQLARDTQWILVLVEQREVLDADGIRLE